jgi:ABC-type nickel/cobalt efflux system permease component RcnA
VPRANVQFENRILVPTLIPEIASNGCDDLRKSARALVMSWAIAYTGFTIWGLQHGRRRIFSISISVPSGSNEQNGHFGADCPSGLRQSVQFSRTGRGMLGILGLGFILGMQHALEADHVAAVSSIAARRSDFADIVRHGLTWGLGHTLTLFAFAGAALALGQAIPEHVARPIEAAVGVMLLGLGGHVLWRLWRDRVHFHKHSHDDGTVHIHAHSHAGEKIAHARAPHAHHHGFRWRTLLVGLMHGMAGSAALLVLTVSQASSVANGLLYVALFGFGSMIGMGALSMIIAVPLALSARWLTWANGALQVAVGIVTIAIGTNTIVETMLS